MTAETDIAAIDDAGENTAAEVRTALTSVLARTGVNVIARTDTPPSSPNTMDDEFDDDSFNTTLWTDLNIGSVTKAELNGGLVLAVNENVNQWRGIYQTAPSGSWEIRTKIYAPPDPGTTYQAGLFAAKSTTERVYYISWYMDGIPGFRALQHPSPTSAVASWGNDDNWDTSYVYFAMIWNDGVGTLSFHFSFDGLAWSRNMASTLEGGWTPGIVGLGLSNRLGRNGATTFDWFRRVA